MYGKVLCGIPLGIEGMIITVETDHSGGLPALNLVGFLSSSVREASERVRSAIHNTGYTLPASRVTVNLSPADVRKDGSGFDLAIAISILVSMQVFHRMKMREKWFEETMFLGELGLDGAVLPVSGVLSIVDSAVKQGVKRFVIPLSNVEEARLIREAEVVGVRTLGETIDLIKNYEKEKRKLSSSFDESKSISLQSNPLSTDALHTNPLSTNALNSNPLSTTASPSSVSPSSASPAKLSPYIDMADIRGQETMKRGMLIAAAGFHNILLTGAAGSGKSMIAKALPGILPPLTYEEQLELTKIYSVAGKLSAGQGLLKYRPFRAPHIQITDQALLGGGGSPKPGEVSLASSGVLFLDEFPEFKKSVIEALRQPLEDRKVLISRVKASYEFPAKFMLVAARNNCPCGFFPDRTRCRCSMASIIRYQSKVSHPIMDRIDIRLESHPVKFQELMDSKKSEDSKTIRQKVLVAREHQNFRFHNQPFHFNAEIPQSLMEEYIPMDTKLLKQIGEHFDERDLSARGFFRILKLARTIADLADREEMREEDIEEAVFYRNIQSEVEAGIE